MAIEKTRRNPTVRRLLRPFVEFTQSQASSGIVLIGCALIALVWANSPFAPQYFQLWQTDVRLGWDRASIDMSLHHWINDGLMAVFFLLVGLEIKREVLVGELSSARQAALPIAAAIGGMAIPALGYLLFNFGTPTQSGWGVPMATDIAFSLGVLALLGSRIPLALKVFLTAFAIVDDLGAVLVIALVYTSSINIPGLVTAAVALLALGCLNKAGVRSLFAYCLFGAVLWLGLLQSGIHATIAGVLLALTIPARNRLNSASNLPTPLERMEHGLHGWVNLLIMPLFALANAGVALGAVTTASLMQPVTLGTLTGLILGKPIGICTAAWLAVRLGIAQLPSGVTWRQVIGAGVLGGIGFTMSLFIATLAFQEPAQLGGAKIGVLIGSFVSAVAGLALLRGTRSSVD